ncbi:hypothetical protein K504DRAFT_491958 [Pleomassaria siparia CBS 279.74]|uniref:Uncharacterized protein n=1 Tax=Pleomassaria siparia CBS 279.74 TaxID=1314801 RepID=A0A6G1K639_9PLEO|nr:hypothetical protein K504DRAFT_491958 [Pleomassaria siparia CBS 279.74]
MLTLFPSVSSSPQRLSPQRVLLKVTEFQSDVRQAHLFRHQFQVTCSYCMFGHPGISAFGFARAHQQGIPRSPKTISLKGRTTPSTTHNRTSSAVSATATATTATTATTASADTAELELLQSLQEFSRRRSTFIDDTPRSFEMSSPKRTESKNTSDETYPGPPNTTNSHTNSIASSLASKVTGRSLRGSSTAHSSQEYHPISLVERRQTGEKRHKYSSLELWAAQHHQEETVETDDIAKVSTFRAIQEYFDSQVSTTTRSIESISRHCTSSAPNIPLPVSPERTSRSSLEPPSVLLANDSMMHIPKEHIPDLPCRRPIRLLPPIRAQSQLLSCDFSLAAEGQYSPYDEKHDMVPIPKQHDPGHPVRMGVAAKAGISTLGRMAPPVLGHEALTVTADLSDLSFYLKNTGPSTDNSSLSKKRPVYKMFKVKRKKSLAECLGSIEGSPSKPRPRPPTPACAREMQTSSGARHLRIVVPTDTLPVTGSGSKWRSRQISITWTDETLNPLASPGLEHAMSDFNAVEEYGRPSDTPLRSPKCPPVPVRPVQMKEHALITREEKTRARKLRDLKRSKRHTDNTDSTADTTAGALATSTPSRTIDREQEDGEKAKMVSLQHNVVSLQRENRELAEALARMMGLELGNGDLEADVVLKMYRRLMFSGCEDDDVEG